MAEAARKVHERNGRSAGNGALMRTGPVALAYLDDPEALVEAAMKVSALTHYEEVARESCAIWCLMIRHAVLRGEFPTFDDIEEWVPHPNHWRALLVEAEAEPPSAFAANAWTVGALQAAWSAITHTPVPAQGPACGHLTDALTAAIRIGHDTDTVAAIAGAVLGARWGMSAVPAEWRRKLHGWPGVRGAELERLAYRIAHRDKPGKYGWPLVDRIDYDRLQYGLPALAVHPYDDGVFIAGATALDEVPDDVDAVVSLCLTGLTQVSAGLEHINFRIMDEAHPSANPNLDFALMDAARTIAMMRDEGKAVLLHCVAAHSRTPTVAVLYAMVRGLPLEEAMHTVCRALPAAYPNAGFRQALARLADSEHDVKGRGTQL